MGINKFVKQLEAEFEELAEGELKPDTSFRDLTEWSSLHALIIIALIDTEYEVTITGQDLKAINTVNELYEIVSSRLTD